MIKDLTSGNPTRLIILFTLPLLIGNVFQQMYSLADALIVGRTLGVDALAAVGCTGSLIFLITGFTWGMASGLAIPTAKHFGAGDMAAMRRSVAAGAIISLGVAIALTGIGLAVARPLLILLRTPPEILADATTFVTVSFAGLGATVFYNFLGSTIRALGDSRTPLIFLILACLLNIALVYAFVQGLGTGVGGAAMATVVSQILSAVACLAFAWRRIPLLRMHKADWQVSRADLMEVARIGLPMGFQNSIIGLGTVILQWALNGLGATAVAAYTAAARIDGIAFAPMMSFSVAIATFTAQNLGARQLARIRAGVVRCAAMTMGFAVAIGVILLAFGYQLAGLFVTGGHSEVMAEAHTFLMINGSMYWIVAALIVFRGAMQGLGHSLIPTVAGFMELALRVAGALLLAAPLGFAGVCLANPLAWLGAAIPVVIAWIHARRRLLREEAAAAEMAAGTDFQLVATVPPPSPAPDAVPMAPLPTRAPEFERV